MPADVILPNLGFGMTEGRLIGWLKQPGDPVAKGQPIAEVESDKATVALEATIDGTLAEILFPADSLIPVGAVIARISTANDPVKPPAANLPITPLAHRVAEEHGINLSGVVGSGPGGKITRRDIQDKVQSLPLNTAATSVGASGNGIVLAAPATRKLARDQHIDLHQVVGTGKNGHITRSDVEAIVNAGVNIIDSADAAPEVMAEIAGRHEIPLGKMRQAIGRRLVQSMQESPHFYVTAELDLTAALARLPKAIGINNLLLYLTVQTLGTLPELNATFENGHLYQYEAIHLAIAVALPTGLITPVLHRANDYSLSGLAERARDLIARSRENRLHSEELGGGTFTVSNLGVIKQIERFTAIINPPQIAILAIGAAKPRPFVIDGGLFVRTTAHLTLSADHRIIDGLIAARFLEAFDQHLQAFFG